MTIDRLNPLHQHFRFVAPAQITVTDAHRAQAVARALCALPPMGHGVYNCPADWGIRSLSLPGASAHLGDQLVDLAQA